MSEPGALYPSLKHRLPQPNLEDCTGMVEADESLLHSLYNREKGCASMTCHTSCCRKGLRCRSCWDDLDTPVLTSAQQHSGNQLLLQHQCHCPPFPPLLHGLCFAYSHPRIAPFRNNSYRLCISIDNLKLSSEQGKELVWILTPDTVVEENVFNMSFTTGRANGFCSDRAAVKVLLASPNLHGKEQGSPHCSIFMKC